MLRPITILFALVASLLLITQAFADGKVFTKSATAKVNIPDQEALIHWADGVETLIIQTSFTGEGDEFAWVVPTPNEPKVTASTTGLFPTLRTLTAPKLRHPQHRYYIFVWLVVSAFLGIASGRTIGTIALIALILFLMSVLLPALGSARGGGSVAVQPLQYNIVGSYEVVVLNAQKSESLIDWLNDNGFKISTDSNEVIQHYLDEGWYLTAARLTPEVMAGDTASTHPLAFRFPVDQPVYPLRLTATGSDALEVDLYVFGPQRAAADGFKAAFCNSLIFPPDATREDWSYPPGVSETAIRHPELLNRVDASAFVTKLSARLTPEDMKQDLSIRWDGRATYTPVRWTRDGAKNIAVNVGWVCLGLTFISLPFAFPRQAWFQQAMGKAMGLVFVGGFVSLLIGYGAYLALPKYDANTTSHPRMYWNLMVHQLERAAASATDPSVLDDYKDRVSDSQLLRNPMTKQAMRIDDSPGNFTYEWTEEGLVITAYGPDGAPLRIDGSEPDTE